MSESLTSNQKVSKQEIVAALKQLVVAGGFVCPLQFHPSVQGVRQAAKFMKAHQHAIDVLNRAEGLR